MSQGTLPWQPVLWAVSAKSAYSPLFVALAFQNGVECPNVDFGRTTAMVTICVDRSPDLVTGSSQNCILAPFDWLLTDKRRRGYIVTRIPVSQDLVILKPGC